MKIRFSPNKYSCKDGYGGSIKSSIKTSSNKGDRGRVEKICAESYEPNLVMKIRLKGAQND